MKELLLALLAKTLNKPENELLSIIFEVDAEGKVADDAKPKADALTALTALHSTHLNDVKKKEREQGHKHGKSESLTALETELKELYGITEDKKGKELVEAIVELKAGASKDKKLTDDDIKKHALYVQLSDRLKKDVDAKELEWKTKFEARDKELEKGNRKGKVHTSVKDLVKAGKYILPTDESKADVQLKALYRDLDEYDFDIQKDAGGKERVVLLDKDGKVVEDSMGHATTLDAKVKELADARWEVQVGESRGGAGNGNKGNGKTGKEGEQKDGAVTYDYKGKVPANDDEYVNMYAAITDENEQVALTKAYEASKTGAK